MTKCAYILFICLLFPGAGFAQDAIDWLRADAAYDDQLYLRSLHYYKKLMRNNPQQPQFYFNIGNVYYRQGEYQRARMYFQRALNLEHEFSLRARILYNLANTHFLTGDYRTSVGLYRRSLRIDPDDVDTRHNLELALRKLQEKKSGFGKSISGSGERKSDPGSGAPGEQSGDKTPRPAGDPGGSQLTLPSLPQKTVDQLLQIFARKEKQVYRQQLQRALYNPERDEKGW